jgi:NTP pyrophosphatase (non-canonical NTP hydrolase)
MLKLNEVIQVFCNADEIATKFPPPNARRTIEKFDKLYINLLEELYEVYDEYEKVKSCEFYDSEMVKGIIYELADCFNYSATIIITLGKDIEETILSLAHNYYILSKERDKYDDIDNIATLTLNVAGIRRNLSNRKWHKAEEENPEKDRLYFCQLINCFSLFMFSIEELIQDSVNECELEKNMSDFIFKKQSITKNL